MMSIQTTENGFQCPMVYTLAMAKYIRMQLQGVPSPLRVEADSLEKGGVVFSLKKGKDVVGEVASNAVVAWWIEDTGEGTVI